MPGEGGSSLPPPGAAPKPNLDIGARLEYGPEMEPIPAHRPPRRLRFGPERRILKRADFIRVYQSGRKSYGRYVTVFCLRSTEPEGELPRWRLGITATKKAGKATARNRQRRLVREYFRLNQGWIPEGWDFVVNTKALLSEAGYHDLSRDLDRTLQRLGFTPDLRGRAASPASAVRGDPADGEPL